MIDFIYVRPIIHDRETAEIGINPHHIVGLTPTSWSCRRFRPPGTEAPDAKVTADSRASGEGTAITLTRSLPVLGEVIRTCDSLPQTARAVRVALGVSSPLPHGH